MYKISLFSILLVIVLFSCKDDWNAHYNPKVETINTNVWEAIQRDDNLSSFVQYVKNYQLDTLFSKDQTYSLFIPTNAAFAQFVDSANTARLLLEYIITPFFIQSGSIYEKKKVQTLAEKFALFERNGSSSFFDGVPLKFESPLYKNGKYFTMDVIAYPKLNLYEYFAANSPLLKNYIDNQDSIIVDPTSRPIEIDSLGNTIYDTIAIIYNEFEHTYFPVSKESRYKTATFVFPKLADYYAGLDTMAQALGGDYNDYRDIPLDWQKNYLIPYLVDHGAFENLLEEADFLPKPGRKIRKLKNLLNDSIVIDYKIGQKTICSNGYAYNYANFKVPDTLWASTIRFEAEKLVRLTVDGKYAWKNDAIVDPTEFSPLKETVVGLSNDTLLKVNFKSTTKYFSLEFNIDRLFPRKFLMVVRTSMTFGGLYDIYVNDVLVRSINYLTDFRNRRCTSVDPTIGTYYATTNGYLSFDCWVNNLTEYGKAKIRFVYKGRPSGYNGNNALSIDYIDFIPK
jgi:uncharacterized surface protein with fasciclin (FAS1) repeats